MDAPETENSNPLSRESPNEKLRKYSSETEAHPNYSFVETTEETDNSQQCNTKKRKPKASSNPSTEFSEELKAENEKEEEHRHFLKIITTFANYKYRNDYKIISQLRSLLADLTL